MQESRSFSGEVVVGEVTPVDEKLKGEALVRAIGKQTQDVHRCLERHIAASRLAELDASEKRIALASDVLEVKTQVRTLALALGVQKPAAGEEKPAPAKAHMSAATISAIILALIAAPGFWAALQALLK